MIQKLIAFVSFLKRTKVRRSFHEGQKSILGAAAAALEEDDEARQAAQDAVWMYESQVLDTSNTYINEDYEAACEGYAYMFDIGKDLFCKHPAK